MISNFIILYSLFNTPTFEILKYLMRRCDFLRLFSKILKAQIDLIGAIKMGPRITTLNNDKMQYDPLKFACEIIFDDEAIYISIDHLILDSVF